MHALNETEMARIAGGLGEEAEALPYITPTVDLSGISNWYLQLLTRNPAVSAILGSVRPAAV